MNEELKYPQKYAVLPVEERLGWGGGYEKVTRGFVASKCYLVEAKTTYGPNGERKISYKVVFPYRDFEEFKRRMYQGTLSLGREEVPEYSIYDGLINHNEVSYVFDSYEEAEYLASIENQDLEAHLMEDISFLLPDWQQKYEKKKEDFLNQLELCLQFGKAIKEKIEEKSSKLTKKPNETK
jgi:hypothetical protein